MACTHVHSVSGVKGQYGMQTIKTVNNDTIKWEMKWNENGSLYIVSAVNYNQKKCGELLPFTKPCNTSTYVYVC